MNGAVPFGELLERWHEFYLMAGTAAVTLMGLLFVGVSVHLESLVREDARHVRVVAMETFMNFFFVMLLALVMLVPDTTARPTGVELAMIGVMRIGFGVRNLRAAWGLEGHGFDRRAMMQRFVPALAGYAILIVVGIILARHGDADEALRLMVFVTGVLLGTATRGAWDLIMRMGEAKHRARA